MKRALRLLPNTPARKVAAAVADLAAAKDATGVSPLLVGDENAEQLRLLNQALQEENTVLKAQLSRYRAVEGARIVQSALSPQDEAAPRANPAGPRTTAGQQQNQQSAGPVNSFGMDSISRYISSSPNTLVGGRAAASRSTSLATTPDTPHRAGRATTLGAIGLGGSAGLGSGAGTGAGVAAVSSSRGGIDASTDAAMLGANSGVGAIDPLAVPADPLVALMEEVQRLRAEKAAKAGAWGRRAGQLEAANAQIARLQQRLAQVKQVRPAHDIVREAEAERDQQIKLASDVLVQMRACEAKLRELEAQAAENEGLALRLHTAERQNAHLTALLASLSNAPTMAPPSTSNAAASKASGSGPRTSTASAGIAAQLNDASAISPAWLATAHPDQAAFAALDTASAAIEDNLRAELLETRLLLQRARLEAAVEHGRRDGVLEACAAREAALQRRTDALVGRVSGGDAVEQLRAEADIVARENMRLRKALAEARAVHGLGSAAADMDAALAALDGETSTDGLGLRERDRSNDLDENGATDGRRSRYQDPESEVTASRGLAGALSTSANASFVPSSATIGETSTPVPRRSSLSPAATGRTAGRTRTRTGLAVTLAPVPEDEVGHDDSAVGAAHAFIQSLRRKSALPSAEWNQGGDGVTDGEDGLSPLRAGTRRPSSFLFDQGVQADQFRDGPGADSMPSAVVGAGARVSAGVGVSAGMGLGAGPRVSSAGGPLNASTASDEYDDSAPPPPPSSAPPGSSSRSESPYRRGSLFTADEPRNARDTTAGPRASAGQTNDSRPYAPANDLRARSLPLNTLASAVPGDTGPGQRNTAGQLSGLRAEHARVKYPLREAAAGTAVVAPMLPATVSRQDLAALNPTELTHELLLLQGAERQLRAMLDAERAAHDEDLSAFALETARKDGQLDTCRAEIDRLQRLLAAMKASAAAAGAGAGTDVGAGAGRTGFASVGSVAGPSALSAGRLPSSLSGTTPAFGLGAGASSAGGGFGTANGTDRSLASTQDPATLVQSPAAAAAATAAAAEQSARHVRALEAKCTSLQLAAEQLAHEAAGLRARNATLSAARAEQDSEPQRLADVRAADGDTAALEQKLVDATAAAAALRGTVAAMESELAETAGLKLRLANTEAAAEYWRALLEQQEQKQPQQLGKATVGDTRDARARAAHQPSAIEQATEESPLMQQLANHAARVGELEAENKALQRDAVALREQAAAVQALAAERAARLASRNPTAGDVAGERDMLDLRCAVLTEENAKLKAALLGAGVGVGVGSGESTDPAVMLADLERLDRELADASHMVDALHRASLSTPATPADRDRDRDRNRDCEDGFHAGTTPARGKHLSWAEPAGPRTSTPAGRRASSSAPDLPAAPSIARLLELERALDAAVKDDCLARAELGVAKAQLADRAARSNAPAPGKAEQQHLQASLDHAQEEQLAAAARVAALEAAAAKDAHHRGQLEQQLRTAEAKLATGPATTASRSISGLLPASGGLASAGPRGSQPGGASSLGGDGVNGTADAESMAAQLAAMEARLEELHVENGALQEKERVVRERDRLFAEAQLAQLQLATRVQLLERELLRRGIDLPPGDALPMLGAQHADPYADRLASADEVGRLRGRLNALEEQNARLLERLGQRGGGDTVTVTHQLHGQGKGLDLAAELEALRGMDLGPLPERRRRLSSTAEPDFAPAGRIASLQQENGRLIERVRTLETSFGPDAAFRATIAERNALDLRVTELVIENATLAAKERFLRQRNEELTEMDSQLALAQVRIRSLERDLEDSAEPAEAPMNVFDRALMDKLLAATEEIGRLQGRIHVLNTMLGEATRGMTWAGAEAGSKGAGGRGDDRDKARGKGEDDERLVQLAEQLTRAQREYAALIEGDAARKAELQVAKDHTIKLEARLSAITNESDALRLARAERDVLNGQVSVLLVENAALAAKEKFVQQRHEELADLDRQLILAQLRIKQLERALAEAGAAVPPPDTRAAPARPDLAATLLTAGEQGRLQGRVETLQDELARLKARSESEDADGKGDGGLRSVALQGQLQDTRLQLDDANRQIANLKGQILRLEEELARLRGRGPAGNGSLNGAGVNGNARGGIRSTDPSNDGEVVLDTGKGPAVAARRMSSAPMPVKREQAGLDEQVDDAVDGDGWGEPAELNGRGGGGSSGRPLTKRMSIQNSVPMGRPSLDAIPAFTLDDDDGAAGLGNGVSGYGGGSGPRPKRMSIQNSVPMGRPSLAAIPAFTTDADPLAGGPATNGDGTNGHLGGGRAAGRTVSTPAARTVQFIDDDVVTGPPVPGALLASGVGASGQQMPQHRPSLEGAVMSPGLTPGAGMGGSPARASPAVPRPRQQRRVTAPPAPQAAYPRPCVVLYDYEPPRTADSAAQLPLRAGDTLQQMGPCRPDGLAPVELYGAHGLAPFRHLEPLTAGGRIPRSGLVSQLGRAPSRARELLPSDHAGATVYRVALLDFEPTRQVPVPFDKQLPCRKGDVFSIRKGTTPYPDFVHARGPNGDLGYVPEDCFDFNPDATPSAQDLQRAEARDRDAVPTRLAPAPARVGMEPSIMLADNDAVFDGPEEDEGDYGQGFSRDDIDNAIRDGNGAPKRKGLLKRIRDSMRPKKEVFRPNMEAVPTA